MDIASGLVALGQVASVMKTVVEVDKAFDDAKFKAQMADALVAVADAKNALLDAREELRKKDEEIARLAKQFAFREELVEVKGMKYRKNIETGGPQGLPFCSRCEEVDGRYLQLARTMPARNMACPHCKAMWIGLPEFN